MTAARKCNVLCESKGQSRARESMDSEPKCRDDVVWPGRVTTGVEQERTESDSR